MGRTVHKTALRMMSCFWTFALVISLLPQGTAAKQVPAGTFIRNVAQTIYFNEALGIIETVYSNAVDAKVAAVPALDVNGYSELMLTRGAMAQYYFEVTNIGNVPLNADMTMSHQTGAAMMNDTRLVHDANANGRIDNGEATMNSGAPMFMDVGDTAQLIYEFRTSFHATPATLMQSVLSVSATSATRIASRRILSGAAVGKTTIVGSTLELQKEQTIREMEVETQLTYTLRLRNDSDGDVLAYGDVHGAQIRIDGTGATGVLLRDEIPLNARFHSITDPSAMVALYHAAGDARHDYQTTRPAGEVDAVAFFHEGDYEIGFARDPAFMVSAPMGLGDIEVANTARSFMKMEDRTVDIDSNTTVYRRDSSGAGILRFEHPETAEDQPHAVPNSDTRLRLTAGACNDTMSVDRVIVTLRSFLTGDVERVTATETEPNSGIFLTPAVPMARMDMPASGDNVVATTDGDRLIATADCADAALEDELLITPGNFLFNSLTNEPIGDVTIALMDMNTGAEMARRMTDARGFFSFGVMPGGEFQFAVMNAPEWDVPSVRADFPGFNRRVASAGFMASFRHSGGMLAVSDIPADPHYSLPLTLGKQADKDTVGAGEFVVYTLNFSNNMNQALIGAEILDRPPYGSQLVAGSVTFNGEPIEDLTIDPSGDMTYALGPLAPLSSHEVSYVMQFTAAAREGRNENTAVLTGRQAGTGIVIQSQTARAMVKLNNSGGVFAREATVIGSVFLDCDKNGIRGDHTEPGIPGVRIVTQEGLSVVTDMDGKYSLFGLRPITHAFLVQEETLPVGTEVTVTRTNDLLRGGSRLIPLRKGELRAEHFAVRDCTPEAMAEVAQRRKDFEEQPQSNALTAADLPIEGQRAPVRSVRSEAGVATTTQLTPRLMQRLDESRAANSVAEKASGRAQRQSLELLIKTLDDAPGFIDLTDGQTLDRRTQSVRVKGKGELSLGLLVNGRELSSDRVGERTRFEKNNTQALDFVAVKLNAGKNTLTLVGRDGFGIERVRQQITVVAPGKPAKFEVILPATAPASPTDVIPVVVRVLDARGLPVPTSGTVTLSAKLALWDVTDIREGTPGVQVYLDHGEATFGLIPPQVAGTDRITISGAFGRAEETITFTPDLDQRIMIGVIEGAVALGGAKGELLNADRFSSFEDTTTGLRGEVYLKGVISGDALLTLRYSSDRDTEDRLFRDIRGDEFYPVYGDNSERGFDAQSSENLYVKVEKGRSYILYGDIAIEPEASALKLDGMRRVVTGAKAHWENDKVGVTLFGARTAQEQRVQEFPGRGVSGPYDLDLDGYVQGSERVELLVRDEEGGDVISTTALRRGTDYLLDFFGNSITFDDAVRQFDGQGNPVSVRVTYEVDVEGADRYWLYGGEVNVALTDRTTVGARIVHADAERSNAARERLHSAYIRHEGTQGGVWEAEAARSEDANGVSDTAYRLSYDIRKETGHFNFEMVHTGTKFAARGGLALPGTTRARLNYGFEIDGSSDFVLGVDYVRDRTSAIERLTVDAVYAKEFSTNFKGYIGLEYRLDHTATSKKTHPGLILGGHWTPANRPGTVITAELRHPFGSSDRPTELTLGMYREPVPGWRAYSEVEMTFGDDTVTTHAKLGFSYDLNDWLRGSTDFVKGLGPSDTLFTQAMMGKWAMNGNTTFSFGIEHSRSMETDDHRLTSVALGAKWGSSAQSWVGDADADTTFEDTGNTHYASFGIAGKITPDFTMLGRTRVALDKREGRDHRRIRSRAGIAYRPVHDPRLEVLAWYEHRIEQRETKSVTHMWSVDGSYEMDADLRLNAKYAGQSQRVTTSGGISARALTQLLQAGFNYEFGNNRFQIGMNVAHLWDNQGNMTNGIGAEIGFAPTKGALIALGYNRATNKSSLRSDLYQEGLYLRFKLLLDNSLWDRLDGFMEG